MDRLKKICNYIISCFDNNNIAIIDNMKLQKLLYYVQGCSLAFLNEYAFNEEIFAWPYGPVVKEAHEKYKHRGSLSLTVAREFDKKSFVKEEKKLSKIIDLVYEKRGNLESVELAYMTHVHDTWIEAINTDNKFISNKAIKKYFTENLKNGELNND